MIGIGIIGCGKIAQFRHIPEYLDNSHVEIRGYFDLNRDRAMELSEKYGGKVYDTVDDLLSAPDIDAVSVCSANNVHAEHTIKALNAGKHVLCEKPMAVKLEDCEKMIQAAQKNKKYLMIDQNQRMAKAHMKASDLIEKGEIGRIISFRTAFGHGGPETWSIDQGSDTWFFNKERAVMGAMADLGIHKTDLIQYLTDSRVVEVTAVVTTLDKCYSNGKRIGVDDNAFCIYKMNNGIIGTMTASWTYYGEEDNSTILYGSKGIMKIYFDPDYSIEIINKDGSKVFYEIDQIQTNDNQTKSGIIDEFINSIVQKKAPSISGESVLTAMRAVFACLEASEQGRVVSVNQNIS